MTLASDSTSPSFSSLRSELNSEFLHSLAEGKSSSQDKCTGAWSLVRTPGHDAYARKRHACAGLSERANTRSHHEGIRFFAYSRVFWGVFRFSKASVTMTAFAGGASPSNVSSLNVGANESGASEKARSARPREISRRSWSPSASASHRPRAARSATESHPLTHRVDEEAISASLAEIASSVGVSRVLGPPSASHARNAASAFFFFSVLAASPATAATRDPLGASFDFFHRPPQPIFRVRKPDSGDDSTIPGSTR